MGADTEETAEIKRSVSKLPLYRNRHSNTLIVGGSGSTPQILTITESLQNSFSEAVSAQEIDAIEEAFKHLIKNHYEEHVLCWPSIEERREQDFSLLIAAIFRVSGAKVIYFPKLWISEKGMLRSGNTHEAIGTGATYARLLMDEFLGMYSIQMAVLIAAYIIQRVKRETLYCGKETQIWRTAPDGVRSVFSSFLEKSEEIFRKYEYLSMKQFFTAVNPEENIFDDVQDINMQSEMAQLRKEIRELSAEMEKYKS